MVWSIIQIEKDVKRINERINEVVKALGTDSKAYNDYVSRIKSLIPGKYQRVDKDGLIKISRSKELYKTFNTEKTQRAFEQILKVDTIGNKRKEAKKALIEEAKQALLEEGIENPTKEQLKPSKEQINEMVQKIDEVEKFVDENREMFYVEYTNEDINDTIGIKGRRKTYSELYSIVEAYQENKFGERKDPFEDL